MYLTIYSHLFLRNFWFIAYVTAHHSRYSQKPLLCVRRAATLILVFGNPTELCHKKSRFCISFVILWAFLKQAVGMISVIYHRYTWCAACTAHVRRNSNLGFGNLVYYMLWKITILSFLCLSFWEHAFRSKQSVHHRSTFFILWSKHVKTGFLLTFQKHVFVLYNNVLSTTGFPSQFMLASVSEKNKQLLPYLSSNLRLND